jgi:DNA polymerase-3 subunit delta'
LEEPPEKTLFILVSEHPELLLSTILSRVQQIRIPKLSEEEIAQGLDGEHKDLARIAAGSYLAAQKLAEESSTNKKYLNDFIALMRDAYTISKIRDPQKKAESLQHIRQWSIDMADAKVGRERQKAFLQYAQRQIRENYIFNLQQAEMNYQTADERAFSQNFAPFINDGNVQQIMDELSKAEQQIGQNGNAKIIFFDLCLQFIVLLKR